MKMDNQSIAPYKSLLYHSLCGGIFDYYDAKKESSKGRYTVHEMPVSRLIKWVESDVIRPFSFAWLCLELEFDVEQVRNRIKKFSCREEIRTAMSSIEKARSSKRNRNHDQ
jgi:hypothetical protein